jgi:hypothetical protein
MTAKGVGPLVFYDGRMNGQTYINIIKSQLLPYIKQNFKENDTWYIMYKTIHLAANQLLLSIGLKK